MKKNVKSLLVACLVVHRAAVHVWPFADSLFNVRYNLVWGILYFIAYVSRQTK